MKIAYWLYWNEGPRSGVFQKVVGHCREWIRQGHSVALFALSRKGEIVPWETALPGVTVFRNTFTGTGGRLLASSGLTRQCIAWRPDIVYRRYDLYDPLIHVLGRRAPIVLEINGQDIEESRLMGRARYLYNRATRAVTLRAAAGVVFVTRELSESPLFAPFVRNTTVIGNGIPLRDNGTLPPPCNDRPALIFVGTPHQPWHGVDKILWLATQRPEWDFHLVGLASEDLPALSPGNVKAHGLLTRSEYTDIMANADVAVASLALHRIAMIEGSPLKTREYLARGLPTILGYEDVDLKADMPFVLQIPNNEDNLRRHLDVVTEFVTRWRGRRIEQSEVAFLDVTAKERVRLNFLHRLALEHLA